MTYSPEFIFSVISAVVTVVVGGIINFVRLEGKSNANTEKIDEVEIAVNNRINEFSRNVTDKFSEVSLASAGRFMEASKGIEKNEIRIERVENRHEQSSNEVRSMLMAIQKSLSTLEGQLSINSRNENR